MKSKVALVVNIREKESSIFFCVFLLLFITKEDQSATHPNQPLFEVPLFD